MSRPFPSIAYLTAGAAGMYCGSCLRDNALAAAMIDKGYNIHLIPTYTPIRTDEVDVSEPTIFYGGVNVFLQQKFPLFRYLPPLLDRWLDRPWLLNRLAERGMETNARELGALTVSMLRGRAGYQRKEAARLVRWLESHLHPDLVNLSNLLIAGCVPELKARIGIPVLVTLQGDDLFLDGLVEPFRGLAMVEARRLAASVDGFLVFSRYYADFMSEYLHVPRDRFHIVSMGLNLQGFPTNGREVRRDGTATIGYLARVSQEKGLHVLIDAFIRLRSMPGTNGIRLKAAGWMGNRDREYFAGQVAKLRQAGLEDAFEYAGVLDHVQKIEFLKQLDVLSVPTVYRDPKGIFVLESLASGVPVVQPEHGAFPELLAATGGGRLVRPEDPQHLAAVLYELLADPDLRHQLAADAHRTVHEKFGAHVMAEQTLEVYRKFLRVTNDD